MQAVTGVALILVGGAVAVSLVTWLRDRFGRRIADALAAAAGVMVAAGGLLVVEDANVWSWLTATLFLAAAAVGQRRALLAPGGPFRT
jgi:Na+/melibiose symporter-like transporter